MKQLFLLVVIGFVSFGAMFFVVDKLRIGDGEHDSNANSTQWNMIPLATAGDSHASGNKVLRAAGKIEGKTETIELGARIVEQIESVPVTKGMNVSKGDVLVKLDSERLVQERDLAKSHLELASARKKRLENGARTSEIEAAKQEYEANLAPFWSADRALKRGVSLFENKAISQQELDDLRANVEAARARAAAAQARLATLEMPARLDEMSAANAEVQAASSRLKIAEINLKRLIICAPVDGQILQINARVGELTGPDIPEPIIVMVDTTQLHAVAEVDEFDALAVELGQYCEITSDASPGILARGKIVEVEPQMLSKKIYGQWAGERNDSFSRRVRILIDESVDLPIGLPIEVAIQTTKHK